MCFRIHHSHRSIKETKRYNFEREKCSVASRKFGHDKASTQSQQQQRHGLQHLSTQGFVVVQAAQRPLLPQRRSQAARPRAGAMRPAPSGTSSLAKGNRAKKTHELLHEYKVVPEAWGSRGMEWPRERHGTTTIVGNFMLLPQQKWLVGQVLQAIMDARRLAFWARGIL